MILFQNTNKHGNRTLNKEKNEIVGNLGGVVINCVYSELPGGCGKTEHCMGCQIRNTVTSIHETGMSVAHKKCYQFIKTPDGPKKVFFLVSGQKLQDIVMLKVEKMEIVGDIFP